MRNIFWKFVTECLCLIQSNRPIVWSEIRYARNGSGNPNEKNRPRSFAACYCFPDAAWSRVDRISSCCCTGQLSSSWVSFSWWRLATSRSTPADQLLISNNAESISIAFRRRAAYCWSAVVLSCLVLLYSFFWSSSSKKHVWYRRSRYSVRCIRLRDGLGARQRERARKRAEGRVAGMRATYDKWVRWIIDTPCRGNPLAGQYNENNDNNSKGTKKRKKDTLGAYLSTYACFLFFFFRFFLYSQLLFFFLFLSLGSPCAVFWASRARWHNVRLATLRRIHPRYVPI